MQLQIREEGDSIYVKIYGELDLRVVDDLRIELDETIDNTNKKILLLDFTEVNFIDSSGLGVILGRYKKINSRGGKVIILNPSPGVKRVMELSGIFNVIEVKESLEYLE